MKYSVDSAAYVAAEIRIADIATHDFEAVAGRHILKPAPVVERIILSESTHFVATGKERLCEMRADKAVGSGDKCRFFYHVFLNL